MKKIIGLIITAAMLTTMLVPSVVTASEETVYSENFENYTPDDSEGNEEVVVDNDTYAIGNAARTNRVASPTDPFVHHTFTPVIWSGEGACGANTYAEVEFDVKPSGISSGRTALISLRGYQNSTATNKEFLDITFDGSENKIKLNKNKTSLTTELAAFSNGEWYRIKLIMQLTNSEGTAVHNVKDVRVNGVSTLTESVSFSSTNPIHFDDIVTQVSRNTSGDYSLSVDNISVKTYVSETGSSPVTEKGALLALIRKAIAGGVAEDYPSLVAAKEVYEDDDATRADVTTVMESFVLPPVEVYTQDFESYTPDDADNNEEIIEDSTYKIGLAAKTNRVASPTDPFVHHTFTPVIWSGEGACGANTYAEVEFDVKPSGLGSANSALISLRGYQDSSNTNKEFLDISFVGSENKIKLNKNKTSLTTDLAAFSDDEWYTVKLVMQLTDESGTPKHTVKNVKVNGESVLSADASFASTGPVNFNDIVTQVNRNAQGDYAVIIDNISVITYADRNLAVEKGKLLSEIRIWKNFVANNTEYSQSDLVAVTDALTAAEAVYNDSEATEADVSDAVEAFSGIKFPETIIKESFEGNSYVIDPGENTFTEIASYTEYGVGNAFKINQTTEGSVTLNMTGAEWPKSGSENNAYAEIEFDFHAANMVGTGKHEYMYFKSGSTNLITLTFQAAEGKIKVKGSGNEVVLTSFEDNKWYRVKLVMQLTDSTGSVTNLIKAVQINGEDMITEPIEFSAAKTSLTAVTFDASKLKDTDSSGTEYAQIFDNISVKMYNSEDGKSKLADCASLVSGIRTVIQDINKGEESNIYSASEIADFEAQLEDAKTVYETNATDRAAVEEAVKKLRLLQEIMQASAEYNQTNQTLVLPDAEYSESDLTEGMSEITVTQGAALISKAASGFEGYAIAVLKKASTDLKYGEIADIKMKKISLSPAESGVYNLTFDLGGYGSEVEDMYIKTFVADKNAKLLSDVSYFNGSEADFEKEGFTYKEDSANIYSGKIDSSDRKLIITVNSGANEAVAIYILKKDVALSQLDSLTDSNYGSVIAYADSQSTDASGNAVFEYNPSESGDYAVVVNTDSFTRGYTETVYFVETDGEINNAFTALYANPTVAGLEADDNYKLLGVNKALYEKAAAEGIDVSSVIEAALDEKTYDADNSHEFKSSFEQKLQFLYNIKTAGSYDTVENTLNKNSQLLPADLKALTGADKREAAEYIYTNRSSVTSMDAFNTVAGGAVTYAQNTQQTTQTTPGADGGGGGGGGGGIKITPSNPLTEIDPSQTVAQAQNVFNDIDSVEWAKEAITIFARKGYINGKSENTFAPNDYVKREEFVKIAVGVFGMYNENANTDFADVGKDAWYYRYIASAYENGAVNGIGENMFGIGQYLTREDAAVLIYRMAQKASVGLTEDGEYIEFIDDASISDYAREGVEELAKSGIINGSDNKFLPKNYCTRAEVVKMLYETYKLF